MSTQYFGTIRKKSLALFCLKIQPRSSFVSTVTSSSTEVAHPYRALGAQHVVLAAQQLGPRAGPPLVDVHL